MFRKIGIATTLVIVLVIFGYIGLDDISSGINKIQGLAGTTETTQADPIITQREGTQESQETTDLERQEVQLTKEELQITLERTPAFQDFPEDGRITLGFFDGNGQIIQSQYFTIEGKEVKEGKDDDADFTIVSGNYWIPDIQQSEDFCQTFKEIKENQDYLLQRKIGTFSALIKYRSLMKYEGCLS